ncbi:hypothetical protein AgCh_022570 [Apium graveolens]
MSENGGTSMDLLRSEAMQLSQLIIPIDSAHLAITYLGHLGLIQFNDLNAGKSPFQRTYATQIKRCGELGRKLRYFKVQMSEAGLEPLARSGTGSDLNVDDLEVKLGELEGELTEFVANGEKLQRSYNELVEYQLVLQKAGEFFHSALRKATVQQRESGSGHGGESSEAPEAPLLEEQELNSDQYKQVKLGFLTGLVPKGKSMAFEKMLFRVTRGNVLLRQSFVEQPVVDPASGEKVIKNVFAVFFSGERVKSKILKICDAFGANRYPFSEDIGKEAQMMTEVSARLSELKITIDAGISQRKNLLHNIGQKYEQWNLMVTREKSIYHILNMLSIDVTKKCLVAEGWSPVFATPQIQEALQRATTDSSSQVGGIFQVLQTKESPPTYFRTNKFTSSFQDIVDAYGDATSVGLIKVHNTYPFGVDPVWHGTRSELPFLNSLKMKMSILLGVAQMNLGIVMSFFNANFFRNGINIWCQFVPQIIFLNSLFGYLSILIIIKWITGSKADLYHVMIYMFLGPTDDLEENQLFSGQKVIQLLLLVLAFGSVPWMLLPKPFLLKSQHNNRQHGQSYATLTDESLQSEINHDSHAQEEFMFSEVFVHQLIHTIEFVLGAVSNTASYLRLWALSLAHSELSSVFYEKVLVLAWGYNNVIIRIVGVFVFICATVGVLLVMETLSAFLHALRLHWVEFQNKFYEGDGYKFNPFSFTLIANEEE